VKHAFSKLFSSVKNEESLAKYGRPERKYGRLEVWKCENAVESFRL
jgi:hypothetical protein